MRTVCGGTCIPAQKANMNTARKILSETYQTKPDLNNLYFKKLLPWARSVYSRKAKYILLVLMCVCVLPVCIRVHHMHAWCPPDSEVGIRSLGTGTVDGCKLPCRCREPSPGPVQKEQVLLTVEPTFQPQRSLQGVMPQQGLLLSPWWAWGWSYFLCSYLLIISDFTIMSVFKTALKAFDHSH